MNSTGALDLEVAHERAREHVAGRQHGRGHVRESVVAGRVRGADVAMQPGCACDHADDAELLGDLGDDAAGVLEPRLNRAGTPQEARGLLGVSRSARSSRDPISFASSRRHVERDAAGADHAAAQAAAADLGGEVEEVAAEPAAKRGRRQIADVIGESAEVAGMVGEPLELERDRRAARVLAGGDRRRASASTASQYAIA